MERGVGLRLPHRQVELCGSRAWEQLGGLPPSQRMQENLLPGCLVRQLTPFDAADQWAAIRLHGERIDGDYTVGDRRVASGPLALRLRHRLEICCLGSE